MSKYRNLSRPLTKAGKLSLFMTMIILLFIISIIGIARLSLKLGGAATEDSTDRTITINDKTGLNGVEAEILMKLAGSLDITQTKLDLKGEPNTFCIYYRYLEERYRNIGLRLSKEGIARTNELINDLDELIHLEKRSQISSMSLDGREVAVYILGQIYELSGMKLVINNEGNIEQISDQDGTLIYQYSTQLQTGFRVDNLLIIVAVILVLICICFNMARRQQLFEKGGEFDGIKEKRIA